MVVCVKYQINNKMRQILDIAQIFRSALLNEVKRKAKMGITDWFYLKSSGNVTKYPHPFIYLAYAPLIWRVEGRNY